MLGGYATPAVARPAEPTISLTPGSDLATARARSRDELRSIVDGAIAALTD